MADENYYDILGVDRKAPPDKIKRAYRELLAEWHPDRNPKRLDEAEEKTKIINQAYHVLKDPNRRKQYDRMLRYTRGMDYSRGIDEEIFNRKVESSSPSLKSVKETAKNLYSMYLDALKGKYKLNPATMGLIVGGLLYFIIPLDAVFDFIPFVGLLDDLAVLTAVSHSIQKELQAYQLWKKMQEELEQEEAEEGDQT